MATAGVLVVAAGCGTGLIGPTAEERVACAELRDLTDALAVGEELPTAAVEDYASAANRTDSLAPTARAVREAWRDVIATLEDGQAAVNQAEREKDQARSRLEIEEFVERDSTSSDVAQHERAALEHAKQALESAQWQAGLDREVAGGRFEAAVDEAAQACAGVGVEVAR